MYKLDHPVDLAQFQAVQRRRRLDQERMKRIFDPKVRVMGIDVQGLEEQIRIKNELKSIEDERNATADQVALETNDLLQMLDAKVAASRRAVHKDMDAFRQDHQQPHMRRDFDLYDPMHLKNDRPARTSDADTRNTVSGMQKFEGEDLEQQLRIKAQKDQMQVWSWQKMRENDADKKRKEEEDWRREREVMENNQRIQVMMEAERLQRKQVAMEDAMFNLKLAMEKKLKDAEHREKETEKNLEEIQLNVTGDFLTERPAPPQPGPHHLRIDAFKGMTPEQIAEIQATRDRQIEEARQRSEQQKRDEQAWAKHDFWVSRATVLMEREKHRAERERERQMLAQNQMLANEFKQRKAYMDKVVYTNPPTEGYFMQFNTTSR
ncbi:RIB43A-like with coiled-coils protein 2-like protein [Catenaria anguillulae PL171]|uniref:RIB43A-like with coiled-coils protein 2-like protein n=1 Tax=Catenaria anguillulae PL171 TaxID=765915 RepID=A0A1Y2HWN7_9FUNG|nr:RIB43A-like with coiled-coils protein 2-like protein [Catenaria anguillulae PL171]